jgi:succinate-semialdehyde dehydrogenase/glutarate-semialdehyde dehydrogenase
MSYQSVNPYNGKLLKSFDHIGATSRSKSALESAAVCFEKWRHTSFAERAAVIAKAASILHARVDDFARPMTLEMGKRINEARGEVEFSSNIWPITPRTPSVSSRR